MPPDFMATAAQIIAIAFSQPTAREQIAQILQLTHMGGEMAGIDEAKRILKETFATEGGKP